VFFDISGFQYFGRYFMNICVSSYSFSRLVREGSLKPENVIYKAKEMGFYGIEFAGLWVPEGMTAIDYAKHLKDLAENVGIKITGYSVGGNLLCNNQEEEIERLKGEVDVAHALGVNLMRHDVAYDPCQGDTKVLKTIFPF
jgi:inosose dehydratase